MSVDACAELVARGDPERFRTVLAAPRAGRPGLLVLYAFNLEVARAPWAATEPMLAEIRLQWWADALDEIEAGAAPRRHEVAGPLAAVLRGGLPVSLAAGIVAARRRDAETAPHADAAALGRYVEATYGNLMELAARHLGAGAAALPVVRRFARGAGIAALLRAAPELAARGRDPLPPGLDVAALAAAARRDLASARAERGRVPRGAGGALLPGAAADVVLRRVAADPRALARGGGAGPAEFARRGALAWRALTGRW